MKVLTTEELASEILKFSKLERSVIFTGAGIGKKVGCPLWPEFIEYLADKCQEYGAGEESQLIRKRVRMNRLIEAAGIYEDTIEIPAGEKTRALIEPFKKILKEEDIQPLFPFFELPFEAVVTTNYESSQTPHPLPCARARSKMETYRW